MNLFSTVQRIIKIFYKSNRIFFNTYVEICEVFKILRVIVVKLFEKHDF